MTTSTTTLDLLKEVILHPEDDTLRLVYADALDENFGEDLYARFIRASIAVASGQRKKWELIGVWEQFKKTFVWKTRDSVFFPRWCSDLVKVPKVQRHWAEWSRGFIKHLCVRDLQEFDMMAGLVWERGGGRVCPPTAHPVEKVTILRTGITTMSEEYVKVSLERRFPGVKFDLKYSMRSVNDVLTGLVGDPQ